ncbi:DUF5058 family protein [Sporosarcina sp. Marseille-Q4943]|uniref:DUF5058 family protein n=1 Tax=Sporosarcina sp. Marseille-Q4943 TaxID=2942204 RepID=UPI00208DCB5C|nr:DUF5058 family protein [Sporosarcina sp. Marseille-Q4943]
MPENVMSFANGTVVWIVAFFVMGVVIFQALKFMSIAKKAAPDAGLTPAEVSRAIRTGFISSLGPSFGIAIVIVSLIALLGPPITMMRIGIIGSAATETAAAHIGAKAFGVELGGAGFNEKAFATVVWTMCLGGMGWLLVTFLFTKSLGKAEKAIRRKNPKAVASISLAAMLGAFGYLASEQMLKGLGFFFAGIASLGIMIVCMSIADKKNISWLREWSLGISMVCGMIVGTMVIALT